MVIKILSSENDMLQFGKKLAAALKPGMTIYLYGPLGAGKTTLTRGILRGFGHQERVKSPSYALVEPYQFKQFNFFHFDLYRLKTPEELYDIGFEEYFNPQSICVIEWPEKAESLLPPADLICSIEIDDAGRQLRFEAHTDLGKKILLEL